MQQSTEIKAEIDKIKALDEAAVVAVADARRNMEGALIAAKAVGDELDTLKGSVGARRFNILMDAHFDDTFRGRAKSYRKIVKADTRQGLLSLGVIPDKERQCATVIKPDPFFSWVNKISGHVRQSKALTPAERVALKGLQRDIEGALNVA